MFECVLVDSANDWTPLSVGRMAELLVYYDQVAVRLPAGRLSDLLRDLVATDDQLRSFDLFCELHRAGKIGITIDNFPAGEILLDAHLLRGAANTFIDDAVDDRFVVNPARTSIAFDGKATNAGAADRLLEGLQMSLYFGGPRLTAGLESVVRGSTLASVDAYSERELKRRARTFGYAVGEGGLTPEFRAFLGFYFREIERLPDQEADQKAKRFEAVEIDVLGERYWGICDPTIVGAGEILEPANAFVSALDLIERDHRRIELAPAPQMKRVLGYLYDSPLHKLAGEREVENFKEVVVRARTVQAAIDAGERTFADVDSLLSRRESFARLVRGKPEDVDLAAFYLERTSAGLFNRSMPQRLVRWGAFALGSYLTGPLGGAVLSALDTLVLGGLKAHGGAKTFVDEHLRKFASS